MRTLRLVLFLWLAAACTHVFAASAPTTYDTRMAEGARLAAEKSWALARDAYAKAGEAATTDDARRWAGLRRTDADWRSQMAQATRRPPEWFNTYNKALTDFITAAETAPAAKDDFWAAAMESRADLQGATSRANQWNDRSAIAAYLGAKPPSPAAAASYIAFLQRSMRNVAPANVITAPNVSPVFVTALEDGFRIATNPDDRAWCALRVAMATTNAPLDTAAASWARAVATAAGTRWETHARAAEFSWRARTGYDPKAEPNSAADFRALLAELNAVRQGLDPTWADDPVTGQIRTSLASLETQWTASRIQVNLSPVNLPGEPLRFAFGAANVGTLSFQINRFTPAEWVSRQSNAGNLPLPTGIAVQNWTVAMPDPATHAWKSEWVERPDLGPGFYLLSVNNPQPGQRPTQQEIPFVVSKLLATAFVNSSGSGSLFVFDQATGAPFAGENAVGWVGRQNSLRTWTGAADASGRIALPPGRFDFNYGTLAALVGGQPVWTGYSGSYEQRLLVDTFLDRPLYRPGESVQWKIIAREQRGGSLAIPTARLRMTVQLNDTKFIDNQPVALNSFGSATGTIVLPPNTRPGMARLTLSSNGEIGSYGTGFFSVDNYVPPAVAATVNLASGADSLRAGREIVVKVQATYLSGGPVGGAAVEGTFSSSLRYPQPFGGVTTSEAYNNWQRELNVMRPAVTDAAGNAEFRLTVPAYVPASTTLTLAARVIPEGGQAVAVSKSFDVTPTSAWLDAAEWTGLRLGHPGEKMTFTAKVLDGAGEPRRFMGTARLMERRWSEAWVAPDGTVVSGPALGAARRERGLGPTAGFPVPWRQIEGNMISLPVDEIAVATGDDGQLNAEFVLPRAGIYQVQVFSGNQPIGARQGGVDLLGVVAADAATTTLAFDPNTLQLIGPPTIAAGGTLRLLVVLPEGQQAALLSLQDNATESSRRVALAGRVGLVEWRDFPTSGSNLNVVLANPVGPQFRSSSQLSISLENPVNRLTVLVAPVVEVPRPGAESSVKLTVRDAANRPVRAEFALSGADEAVNRLGRGGRSDEAQPLFLTLRTQTLWPAVQMQRPNQVNLQNDFRTGAVRNPKAPGFANGSGLGGARGGGGGRGGAQDSYAVESFDFGRGPNGALFGDNGGLAGISSTQTRRAGLDLEDTPAVYSIINREFIDALGITDLAEASSWATGQSFSSAMVGGGVMSRPIQVRQHFGSTTLWAPSVVTDDRGEASVPMKYLDNLTQWRFEAYAIGENGRTFGQARAFTRTSLPLQSRLQLPRFLVAGDTAQPTALLVNRTDDDMAASVALSVEGSASATNAAALQQTVSVKRQGESTVPLPIKANTAGTAKFSGLARAGAEGDAMISVIPVLEDGIQQQTAATGRLAVGAKRQSFSLQLPTKLTRDRTGVSVQLSPSYAAAILDALPYLVDYPYGCVEQTMNRFMPAVVVRKALTNLGFDAAAVEARILGRESVADATRRQGTAGLGRLDLVIQDGVDRLAQSMSPDGGFGWWPGAQSADPWMTAYVMWGAVIARESGVRFPQAIEARVAQGLVRYTDGVLKLPVDMAAGGSRSFLPTSEGSVALLVAAAARSVVNRDRADPELVALFDRLYGLRDRLPAAGRACLLLACRTLGTAEQRAVLLRNLENGAQRSKGPGLGDTVQWGEVFNYRDPMEGGVEATSLNLLALLDLDPSNALVEPALNWLLLNRRSAHWDSTRSTAFAVLALSRALEVRKEAQPETSAELRVNGKTAGRIAFTRASLLNDPAPFVIDNALLRGGANTIEVVRTAGNGPVYATALASSWATGAAVKPEGNLMSVERGLERLKPQPTLLGTAVLVAQTLADGGTAGAGEQVAARVRLTVPNALQYVKVEVPKPAGCEPLNALSGWDARLIKVEPGVAPGAAKPADGRAIYREEHDDRTVFFLDRIDSGTWEIRFTMRATTPGDFRILPAEVEAMYVPEVRANSDARRLRIDPAP